MFAAVSPVLLGVAGLAVEASYWQLHQRAMQNAADLAAIAAGMEGGTNYVAVAKAVAAQYGFVNGSGNIAVNVTNPTSATGCTSNCYLVSISDQVPLFLSAVVGYQGTSTVNSKPRPALTRAPSPPNGRGEPFAFSPSPAAAPRASPATGRRSPTCKGAT